MKKKQKKKEVNTKQWANIQKTFNMSDQEMEEEYIVVDPENLPN